MGEDVESRGGLSPPGAPRSVHEPLDFLRLPMFKNAEEPWLRRKAHSSIRVQEGHPIDFVPAFAAPIEETSWAVSWENLFAGCTGLAARQLLGRRARPTPETSAPGLRVLVLVRDSA